MSSRLRTISLVYVLILSVLFCHSGTACAESSGVTVSIQNKSDFFRLVADCALDSWSKGVTVELETDLDFGGEDSGSSDLHTDEEVEAGKARLLIFSVFE